jgi:hypothetical protein
MNRAHCDQCDKVDDSKHCGWLKLNEYVFPKPFPKGLADDVGIYGHIIENDFCSFKCLKAFVAALPDTRKGYSLSELLSKKEVHKRWKIDTKLALRKK